jgi:hypothetical protein
MEVNYTPLYHISQKNKRFGILNCSFTKRLTMAVQRDIKEHPRDKKIFPENGSFWHFLKKAIAKTEAVC